MAKDSVLECKVCCNSINNSKLFAREMMFGYRDEFEYFQCAECGCIQISNIPSNIEKYYPNDYYSFSNSSENLIRKTIKNARIQYSVMGTNFFSQLICYFYPDRILNSLRKAPLIIDKNTKILDIGCGSGESLKQLFKLGFKNLHGIDPYLTNEISFENNLKIEKKDIDDILEQYDVIMLHHVFEHLDNPIEVLKKIKKILLPNGVLIIRIPISDSSSFEKYKTNWVQFDAPRHLFLHTIKSIETLCLNVGFTVNNKYYDSFHLQFSGSERYIRNIPLFAKQNIPKLIKEAIKKPFYSFKARHLNMKQKGDQVVLYLKLND